MAVPFENIPENIRVPLFYGEFRSGGTPYVNNARLLLIGQKLTAGSAVAGQPILVQDSAVAGLFGANSMLAQMHKIARKNAPLQEIWALPLADFVSGVAATGTITVAGAPVTQTGVASVYIAGRRVRVGILSTDTNNTIATNLAAAINAAADLPVTATVASAVVTLTARHKGTLGNFIEVDLGYLTEEGPLGKSLFTIVAMANGAGDPDIDTALDALGDDEFDWLSLPYSGATELGHTADLLNDVSGRWSWIRQLYGHATTVGTGSVGTLAAFGLTRNNQHESIFPCRKFRSAPWETCAAVGAQIARRKTLPPELSRPLHTIKLEGIKGPLSKADILTKNELQTFYFSGISGYHVRRDGSVCIDRVVTTYKTNAWGDPDWTYLDIETMAQSMYYVRSLRTEVTTKHGRQALARTNPAQLPHIVTPLELEATLDHNYLKNIDLGVVENFPAFQANRRVEINELDPNRADAFIKIDHVNQLRIFAALIENNMQLAA